MLKQKLIKYAILTLVMINCLLYGSGNKEKNKKNKIVICRYRKTSSVPAWTSLHEYIVYN